MKDYALAQACAADAVASSLATLFTDWRAHREVVRSETCDDSALHQISVTREDVRQALRLPLTENSLLALDRFALLRGRTSAI